MSKPAWTFALSMVIAACGGESGPSGAGGSGGGTGGTGGGDPNAVTLVMGPFRVPPGQEIYKCRDFANPFGGVDTDVKTYEAHMTTGSHHMFVFFNPSNTNSAITDCPQGGFEFHPYALLAQAPDAEITYPDGVGSLVSGSTGFRLDAHYVNASPNPIDATVTVVMRKAPPGSVTQHAGVIFMNKYGLSVPAHTTQTESATCTIPADVNILSSDSHMHRRATHFLATTNTGTTLYDGTEWSDPRPRLFDPPLALAANTQVTFACTYNNDTDQTLTFGEYAQTNIMCILVMHYFPVPPGMDPTITCMAP